MTTEAARLQKRNFSEADEVRPAGKGEGRFVNVANVVFSRATLQPGWRWSKDVKPITHTDSCQATHHGVVVSGRLRAVMQDGSEEEFGPGDLYYIPPGHDAWVVGDEAYVSIDVAGDKKWAKPA